MVQHSINAVQCIYRTLIISRLAIQAGYGECHLLTYPIWSLSFSLCKKKKKKKATRFSSDLEKIKTSSTHQSWWKPNKQLMGISSCLCTNLYEKGVTTLPNAMWQTQWLWNRTLPLWVRSQRGEGLVPPPLEGQFPSLLKLLEMPFSICAILVSSFKYMWMTTNSLCSGCSSIIQK